jgi:hypothetical protein
VILPRHERERGRDREDLGAAIGERPVELGEPDVETDRKAELADRGVGHDDVGARGGPIALEETHAAVDVDVEQMELPIGREPIALRTEEHGRVVRAALVAGFGDASDEERDAEPRSECREARVRRPIDRLGERDLAIVRAEEGGRFGCRDELGARAGGALHQRFRAA